jgi:hypothetical protein
MICALLIFHIPELPAPLAVYHARAEQLAPGMLAWLYSPG